MTLCSFGRSVLTIGLVLGFRSVSLIAGILREGWVSRRFSHSCAASSTAFDAWLAHGNSTRPSAHRIQPIDPRRGYDGRFAYEDFDAERGDRQLRAGVAKSIED